MQQNLQQYEVLKFKAMRYNDSMHNYPGFYNATWDDVNSHFELVKKFLASHQQKPVQIELGSLQQGASGNFIKTLDDMRDLEFRLIVNRVYCKNNTNNVTETAPFENSEGKNISSKTLETEQNLDQMIDHLT